MSDHWYIRQAIHNYLEDAVACNITEDGEMQIGYVFTSVKPDLRWFWHPFQKLLQRQHISITELAANTPENAAKVHDFQRLVNETKEKPALACHVEKLYINRKGKIDVGASKYGAGSGDVKMDAELEIDFGGLSYKEANEADFHKILDGLQVDFSRWRELEVRRPQSIYIVWRVDISEKLICHRKMSTEAQAKVETPKLPADIHASVGGGMENKDDLDYKRETKGPIGFKCARFHLDEKTMRLSMVKFDYTARSNTRIDRLETDSGADPEGTSYCCHEV